MEAWKSSLSAHKLSNIFMTVGFTIAFLAMFLGISLNEYNEKQEEEIQGYTYSKQSVCQVMGFEKIGDELDALLQQSDVNIDLFQYTIYLNDLKKTRMCEVRLKQSEPSIYPLLEGSWEDNNTHGEVVPTVVVGRSYKPYLKKKDGASYLTINYCEYKVTGILSGENGTLDSAVILNYDTMQEEEREKLMQTSFLGLRFGSEVSEVSSTSEAFKQAFVKKEIHYEASQQTNSAAYNTAERDNIVFYALIYMFALGICVICSEFWIYERKTEIVICKTFGWCKDQIIERYYKELLRVLSVGVGVSFVLQMLISVIAKQYVSTSLYYLCLAICMIIISSVVTFVTPMIKVQKYMPKEMLTKESELV